MNDAPTPTTPAMTTDRGYSQWPIKAHNIYLARQGSYDAEGRFSEIAGVLTLHIPEIEVNGKKYAFIEIFFRSAGSRRTTTGYGDGRISLEHPAEDMGAWVSALSFPKKYLDISTLDPKYLRINLYAGSA